jgi:hypothetical protein
MTELGGRIEQEQKIKRPLLKMFKTLEIKRIERLWQELQNEPVEVQSVVRPYYELVKEFARISEEAESTGLALTDKVKELTELKSYSAEREKIYQGLLAELARLTA